MLFRSALYCSVLLCCVVLYFVFLCIAVLCRFSLGNSLGLEMIKRKRNANNKPTDREKSTVLTNKNKRARVLVGLGSAYAQDTHVLSTSRRFHRFDWSIERCIIRHMESQTPEKNPTWETNSNENTFSRSYEIRSVLCCVVLWYVFSPSIGPFWNRKAVMKSLTCLCFSIW